jgi:hypothetical protein
MIEDFPGTEPKKSRIQDTRFVVSGLAQTGSQVEETHGRRGERNIRVGPDEQHFHENARLSFSIFQ